MTLGPDCFQIVISFIYSSIKDDNANKNSQVDKSAGRWNEAMRNIRNR